MMMIERLFWLVIIVVAQLDADPIDLEHELMADIATRYRVTARQLRDKKSLLPFEFHFPIHEVIRVDSSSNEYLIRASIQLIYQFEFLHWNSHENQSRYYRIEELILSKSTLQSLWLPDIYAVDDDLVTFHLENESAKINRDGRMLWTRRGLFTISSPIDLTFYPFDHQYLHLTLFHRQRTFQLQYQETKFDPMIDIDNQNETSNVSKAFFMNKPILSRGWFVRILSIEPKQNNETLENLTLTIYFQRRRESHIYSTILPTLFLSAFIFIYYISSIQTQQRLILTLIHLLATLSFLIHLDRKISADQLRSSPILLRYLSILFLIEILSLFFDHIIHSIYYGGIHFASHWFNQDESSSSTARLASVTLLNAESHPNETLMKQFIQREETAKLEDQQEKQWHKHARLSECLCCCFFFVAILLTFLCMFFILPKISVQ